MTIVPIKKVEDYPNTDGKRVAMNHYDWDNKSDTQRAQLASKVLAMAKQIDGNRF